MSNEETHLWVLVSRISEDAKAEEVPSVLSGITSLVDK